MAARRRQPERPPVEIRDPTPDEMRRSVQRLHRRTEETRALTVDHVRHDDPRVGVLTDSIRTTIRDVFGPNSPEHEAHGYHRIWYGAMYVGMPDPETQGCFEAGIPHTVAMLEGLVARLEERLGELGPGPVERARATFDGLELHPRIAGACAALYRDGHYASAVLNASMTLLNFVKEKSGRSDLDGAPLVQAVFSVNGPRLAFNGLADQSDRDEQQGMMFLFAGAVLALRNPRAHRLLQDSPEEALDYIAFLSMLARQVDRSKLQP